MSGEEIKQSLIQAGFQEEDVTLAQQLTRRGLETHLNLTRDIEFCKKCDLAWECHGQDEDAPFITSKRVIGTGPWNSPLMIVSDHPGEEEERYQVPYIGKEGQLLTLILSKANIDRNAIYMTYAIKCASTRRAKPSEMIQCRNHYAKEVEAVNPKVILTFGETAMKVVRGKYDLNLESERNEIWLDDENRAIIHTHSLQSLLHSDNRRQLKIDIWNDVNSAVEEVKKARPNYTYDRVGLKELIK